MFAYSKRQVATGVWKVWEKRWRGVHVPLGMHVEAVLACVLPTAYDDPPPRVSSQMCAHANAARVTDVASETTGCAHGAQETGPRVTGASD